MGCAGVREPPPTQREQLRKAVHEPSAPVSAEPALGVVDRGIFADLDARIQLPAPPVHSRLTALVDRRRSLLVVYADGWPHKVYPLGGPVPLLVGSVPLALRPGDRSELAGRLEPAGVKELAVAQAPPPGDQDDDGIPDPLDLVVGAQKAALDGASYDDSYFTLAYPNGDPPRDKGACVDVIVRASRNAGLDLQKALVEDARAAPSAYGIPRLDPSIDHRRVRNVVVYFKRHWIERSARLDDAGDPLRPGDVVFLDTLPRPGPDHVGIVTQAKGESGFPLVVNLWTFGFRTQAMDLLGVVPTTHRFRFPSRPGAQEPQARPFG
jgi:uncharacterized protein